MTVTTPTTFHWKCYRCGRTGEATETPEMNFDEAKALVPTSHAAVSPECEYVADMVSVQLTPYS